MDGMRADRLRFVPAPEDGEPGGDPASGDPASGGAGAGDVAVDGSRTGDSSQEAGR